MNVAERLRAAADRLESLDREATGPPWSADEVCGWLAGPDGQDMANAELIATLRPLAPVLAGQLRVQAIRAGNITKDPTSGRLWHGATWCNGEVTVTCGCFDDALALADTVLGGAS